MPIVNYVREHTRFIQYASDEHIPANERLLWYALMHIMNGRAQGNVWPDEFIRINNDLLLSYCAMRYDTMAAARNGLKQRGLIDYEPGKKNTKSPAYRMIYFYPEYVQPESESNNVCYPKISDNIRGNIGGNIGGKPCYNTWGNMPNNIINYTKDNTSDDKEKDVDDDLLDAREEVKATWTECFGKPPNDYQMDAIARKAVLICEFAPGVISRAIRITAYKGPDNPMDYLCRIFTDWKYYHLHTTDDVDNYLFLRDAATGKWDRVLPREEANEKLRQLRENE